MKVTFKCSLLSHKKVSINFNQKSKLGKFQYVKRLKHAILNM